MTKLGGNRNSSPFRLVLGRNSGSAYKLSSNCPSNSARLQPHPRSWNPKLLYIAASPRRNVANPFIHVELNAPDPQKAQTFYSKLFQWQLEDVPNPEMPDGTDTVIKVGDGTGG